jgi:Helix-turn-helix domain
MLKRHEIQVLRRAGHTLEEVVELAGVSQSSVQRVEAERAVRTFDSLAAMDRAHIERVSEHEHNCLACTQIRQPVPSEHALGRHREVLAIGCDELEKRLGRRGNVLGTPTRCPLDRARTRTSSARADPRCNSADVVGYRIAFEASFSGRMVVSANTFFDGSFELPSPPKTGASISISAFSTDAPRAARRLTRSLGM